MLSIVTHPDYDIPLPDGHRFPATKFSALMRRLAKDGINRQFTCMQPEPASRADLLGTQDKAYVDAIADGTLDAYAIRTLGLKWSRVLANRSFLAVNGTLLAAAEAAEAAAAAAVVASLASSSPESSKKQKKQQQQKEPMPSPPPRALRRDLYDAAVAAGTLLVRSEDDARRFEEGGGVRSERVRRSVATGCIGCVGVLM